MKYLIALLLVPCALIAGERRALVIGNNDYPAVLGKPETGTYGKLDTCVNDAKTMRELLTRAGFRLEPEAFNLSRAGMVVAVTKFAESLKEGDTAVLYFAGHGLEFRKNVYMMGTNALGILDTDLDSEGLSEAAVAEKLGQKKLTLSILILDCCREKAANETFFADTLVMRSRLKTRSGQDAEHSAAISPPPDVVVLYATSGGRLTNDRLSATAANGPVVTSLKKHWDEGKLFELMWKDVAKDVEAASLAAAKLNPGAGAEVQRPSIYGQTTQDFAFMSAGSAVVPPAPSPAPPPPVQVAKMGPSQGSTGVPPVSVPNPTGGTPALPSAAKAGDLMTATLPGGATLTLRYCPAGSFTMGSPTTEAERSEDEAQVQVTLSKGFYMGQTEVTQAQWQAVMGSNPSRFKGDDLPVETVSWEDAQKFITALNGRSSLPAGLKWALPTEAQWEYACRAGTRTATAFGDTLTSAQANFDGKNPYGTTTKGVCLKETKSVGSYEPNAWGLYDMHGNVDEWCLDAWNEKSKLPGGVDPVGRSGPYRVYRGGSWSGSGRFCRSAMRFGYVPALSLYNGFRVAAVPAGAGE